MSEKAGPLNNYHYNRSLKILARNLRNNSTKAEIYLWNDVLKGGYLKNYKFLRQRPVLNYIADFMCQELMLIIEVDGETHEIEEVAQKDLKKTTDLENVGFTVLRFSDWEVLNRIWDVAEILMKWIEWKEKTVEIGDHDVNE
jgi:very-short-patch-repair endonuclease